MSLIVDAEGRPHVPPLAPETVAIIRYVRTAAPGTLISYDRLAAIAGRDVRPGTAAYFALRTARRILERDHSMVLECEPTLGLRVCFESEKVTIAGRFVGVIQRAAQRARGKLAATHFDELDENERRRYQVRASLLGSLALLATPAAEERLERACQNGSLPPQETLRLFTKGSRS